MAISFFRSTILPIIGTDVDSTIDFLKSEGLLRRCLYCTHCLSVWSGDLTEKSRIIMCESVRTNSAPNSKQHYPLEQTLFFINSRIELQMDIYAIYLWSTATPHKVIADRTGINPGKVTELSRYLRDICQRYFLRYPIKLGGEGVVCQIDESLFNHKQKYHTGRISENKEWVFGIVDTS